MAIHEKRRDRTLKENVGNITSLINTAIEHELLR